MADIAAQMPAQAASTPKKKAAKAKKPRMAPSHPKVAEMVTSAISSLKERGGSSLQAIKKYIASHYKVDVERLSPFIKKYLKTSVASGTLVQTKGKGATGSFRLSASSMKTKEVSVGSPVKRKSAAGRKPKVPAAKKPRAKKAEKKPRVKKAKPQTKKPKAAKSPRKSKAARPKAPKVKRGPKPGAKRGPKKGGRR